MARDGHFAESMYDDGGFKAFYALQRRYIHAAKQPGGRQYHAAYIARRLASTWADRAFSSSHIK